jgi:hypothetical protein
MRSPGQCLTMRLDNDVQLRTDLEVCGVESVDRLNAVRFHRRDDLQIENAWTCYRMATQRFNKDCQGDTVDRENG